MSTNAQGTDPLTEVKKVTTQIAGQVGVLQKLIGGGADPTGGQLVQMLTNVIDAMATFESTLENPPPPQAMMPPGMPTSGGDAYDEVSPEVIAQMIAAEQGGGMPAEGAPQMPMGGL